MMAKSVISTKEGRMLNRDFSKSNKDYFAKNKVSLIVIISILVLGLVFCAIFGLNANYEFTGYNEFSITVGTDSSKYDNYIMKIESNVNKYAEYQNVQIFDEGDDTKIIVKYVGDLSSDKQTELNTKISADLQLDISLISSHTEVSPIVEITDIIYSIVGILLLLIIAIIFTSVRYNSASALTLLISCLIATLGFISLSAILRLSVGLSYLAMLSLLNILVMYLAIQVFETIRQESFLDANNYSEAIKSAMNKIKFRSCIISSSILVVGVAFALFAPITLKYLSLNILFMAVVLLASVTYLIPFCWSVFITLTKRRNIKSNKSDKKDEINKQETSNSSSVNNVENEAIDG